MPDRSLISLLLVPVLLLCPFLCDKGRVAQAAPRDAKQQGHCRGCCGGCASGTATKHEAPRESDKAPYDCDGLCNSICGGAILEKEDDLVTCNADYEFLVDALTPCLSESISANLTANYVVDRAGPIPISGRALRTLHVSFLC